MVQAADDAHDTPYSSLDLALTGFGIDAIDQVLPSHSSAKAWSPPVAEDALPTAMQAVLDAHETLVSRALAPEGLGAF